jgi:hypothetical protein
MPNNDVDYIISDKYWPPKETPFETPISLLFHRIPALVIVAMPVIFRRLLRGGNGYMVRE